MVERKIIRLWLPKRIDGKWRWLKKCWKITDTVDMCIEGKNVKYKAITYKL